MCLSLLLLLIPWDPRKFPAHEKPLNAEQIESSTLFLLLERNWLSTATDTVRCSLRLVLVLSLRTRINHEPSCVRSAKNPLTIKAP